MKKSAYLETLLISTSIALVMPFAAYAEEMAPQKDDGEIVVITAQHRKENAQKASVSIDVLSSKTLLKAGVSQATDIPRIAPGVQITQGGTALQIYIRGAGDFTTTAYSNAAVAQNFDGVSAGRTQYVAGTFFDLARVEVLKGPQGTLYGRNATGGALNLIPETPKIGEFGGYISAGIQNYNGISAEGALNLPLGEHSAARVSYQLVSRDGYISDGTDDDKHESLRAQFLYEPSEKLSLRLLGNYQHIGGKGAGLVVDNPNPIPLNGLPVVPSDAWTGVQDSINALTMLLPNGPATALGPNRNTVALLNIDEAFQDIKAWGFNAHLDWNLGFATLTFIPAIQEVEIKAISFPTFKYIAQNPVTGDPQTSTTNTYELRLGNSGKKAKWVLGAYYFNEDQYTITNAAFGAFSSTIFEGNLNTESVAAFGEVTYSLTDKLRAIAGLRYTEEEKSVLADQWNSKGINSCLTGSTASNAGPGGACFIAHIDKGYQAHRLNYRAGVEYDLGANNLLFATISTGFKSGGQTNAALPPYEPEDLTAYTIGSKNKFWDNKLTLNAELFYIDYQNHQENVSRLDQNGAPVSSLVNAGSAISKGVSLDTIYRPTKNDSFRFAVEYNKAYFTSFTYLAYRSAPSVGCPFYNNNTTPLASYTVVCDNYQMTRTPEWSGSFSYTHTFEFANGANLEISPDMTFASERWLEPSFVANSRAPSYQVYNLSATYNAPDGKYSLQAFVRNLTNEAVFNGGQQRPFINGYVGKNIGAPKTYGMKLRVNF